MHHSLLLADQGHQFITDA